MEIKVNRNNIEWITTYLVEEEKVERIVIDWVNLAMQEFGIVPCFSEGFDLEDTGTSDHIAWRSDDCNIDLSEGFNVNMSDWVNQFLPQVEDWYVNYRGKK